jgi:hypothetical protein
LELFRECAQKISAVIKNPTEEHQSNWRHGNVRQVFVWSPKFMNVKANCVVCGRIKRRCVVQDAEVQGAT